MCVSPNIVTIRGLAQKVACRKCWQCTAHRVQDWAGRVIAEKEYCRKTSFVTLTYGKTKSVGEKFDDIAAFTLIYRDVQLYLKRLRKAGFSCRYLLSGEYGTKKGRSHWHLLLFWEDRCPLDEWEKDDRGRPLIELDAENICWVDPFWPHGFTNWKGEIGYGSANYVCKYMLKDEEGEAQFHMSKVPCLGHNFMVDWAIKHIDAQLPLHDGFYWFPHVQDKKGLPRKFQAQGAAARAMCATYAVGWEMIHGTHFPHSDFVMAYLDSRAQRMSVPYLERRLFVKRPDRGPCGETVFLDERRNAYYCLTAEGAVLLWSFDGRGDRAWRDDGVIVTPTQAEALREVFAKATSPDEYRKASGR